MGRKKLTASVRESPNSAPTSTMWNVKPVITRPWTPSARLSAQKAGERRASARVLVASGALAASGAAPSIASPHSSGLSRNRSQPKPPMPPATTAAIPTHAPRHVAASIHASRTSGATAKPNATKIPLIPEARPRRRSNHLPSMVRLTIVNMP